MPNHKSAEERVRRNERDNDKNRHYKKLMRDSVKAVLAAKGKKEAQELLKKTTSLLDKMVVKGILHKNSCANKKSVLAKKVGAMA
jgi:small subunit ribosomal protein S20